MDTTNPPWVDENGREWDTADGHPILMGHDQEPKPVDAEHRHKLTPAECAKFVLAGNATITLVGVASGQRYTFKVKKPDDFNPNRPIWFVSVLKGSNNEADFGYIGQIMYAEAREYIRGRKCWPTFFKASDAFAWFWKRAHRGVNFEPHLEVWHEGRCGKCGRKLTVPESIASGFGPECINNV